MTLKDKLHQAIDALPAQYLSQALDLLRSLQHPPIQSTAASFLAHLQTLEPWSGDDLPECAEAVAHSRIEAQFDYRLDPFE
ncbi:MAG: hypothetical protein ACFCA4_17460 [Cyanophyceae cyanobacterium]